ncbi:hypothetical protein, variant [Capsaspora owczarzaki ATCC 30864]|nr:hypothetical protein, variant [Capsaspora owczarzaki ATCC 30864]|eukprot:XP_011270164.1 hypothetical protein, variant [Capsaspora owczarzaki ATCC 30864]
MSVSCSSSNSSSIAAVSALMVDGRFNAPKPPSAEMLAELRVKRERDFAGGDSQHPDYEEAEDPPDDAAADDDGGDDGARVAGNNGKSACTRNPARFKSSPSSTVPLFKRDVAVGASSRAHASSLAGEFAVPHPPAPRQPRQQHQMDVKLFDSRRTSALPPPQPRHEVAHFATPEAYGCRVYIRKLPIEATEQLLKTLMREFGPVYSVYLQQSKNVPGRFPNNEISQYGTVRFYFPSDAERAVYALEHPREWLANRPAAESWMYQLSAALATKNLPNRQSLLSYARCVELANAMLGPAGWSSRVLKVVRGKRKVNSKGQSCFVFRATVRVFFHATREWIDGHGEMARAMPSDADYNSVGYYYKNAGHGCVTCAIMDAFAQVSILRRSDGSITLLLHPQQVRQSLSIPPGPLSGAAAAGNAGNAGNGNPAVVVAAVDENLLSASSLNQQTPRAEPSLPDSQSSVITQDTWSYSQRTSIKESLGLDLDESELEDCFVGTNPYGDEDDDDDDDEDVIDACSACTCNDDQLGQMAEHDALAYDTDRSFGGVSLDVNDEEYPV